MITNKTPAPAFPQGWSIGVTLAPPETTEQRLHRIAVMGQRITGHVEFIRGVGTLGGASAEAKEKAVRAFYERLTALERQLARILDQLRLG
jgi:hypothetical protein